MIVFKQKDFTLAEGHYTGSKDQDKIPGALEVIGKSALGGALAGSAVGAILKDSTALEGAITGGKWGAIAGAAFKFFLNYLHNPMTRVKYQEVDKVIRREFGIYRASGVTVGDSISKRANLDEKFAFNDRKITSFKLTFTVQNDQVTMYTFNLTDKELEKVDSILDYYCKKYTGMEYSSTVLNRRYNAYSAVIIFTNYQVISNFIMELSNALETKINLMDNKALVQGRISEVEDTEEEKTFSDVKDINKFDFAKILGKTACIVPLAFRKPFGEAAGHIVMKMLALTGDKVAGDTLVSMGVAMPREAFSNKYLLDTLKKLHYLEDIHFTIGRKDVNANISMLNGRFVITVAKGEDQEKLDKEFWGSYKRLVNRADTGRGNVVVYTYLINSRKEFEGILNKLFSTDILFNIFEG